ncbi:DNA polymerase/3'-5' exonuclease PolX [Algoriphagus namhaensis]
MDQKTILKQLKLTIQLMELHEENPFKIRSYQGALNSLDRMDQDFSELSLDELGKIQGVGKGILEVIDQLRKTGSHTLLDELLENTPSGILEVLQIKGLGPKKVKALWKDLGITSTHELLEACQSGEVAKMKGFGEKTQTTIIQNLEFKASNEGKWIYADIEDQALSLEQDFGKALAKNGQIELVGAFVRKLEIIDQLELLCAAKKKDEARQILEETPEIEWSAALSSPFSLRGKLKDDELHIEVYFCKEEEFLKKKLILNASKTHLQLPVTERKTMAEAIAETKSQNEAEFYASLQLQVIPAELREGLDEVTLAKENKLPKLLEDKDLKGILHNHSTYSDGKHSLRQMAEHCKELGYEYLGITDHSRSAFYAGGLEAERIKKQHEEIDALNKELAPFRIFKGIESDILADGSLDYPEEVLASFDFIVSSVHSILNMDVDKATRRLITAIQNPHTTMLGHPTGRLLLRRKGYPINHQAVIDACAEHGVVIEINANPWRLDLDWRWIRYALEKGVKLSINPDAHEMDGYQDMKYGVLVGRKGGLTADMTLNTLGAQDLATYFENRKKEKRK